MKFENIDSSFGMLYYLMLTNYYLDLMTDSNIHVYTNPVCW